MWRHPRRLPFAGRDGASVPKARARRLFMINILPTVYNAENVGILAVYTLAMRQQ